MLVISIIIIVLVLLAALFVISDYIEHAESEIEWRDNLIAELSTENTKYRKVVEKWRKNDSDCWGR